MSTPVVLHADPEHQKLGITVIAILIASFIPFFLLINVLARASNNATLSDFALVLSCVGGLAVSLGVAQLAEILLKRSWHSGFDVELSADRLALTRPDGERTEFGSVSSANVIRWSFGLREIPRGGRERRVPASYRCLACQVQRDEDRLILFSLLPVKQATPLLESGRFFEIRPTDLYESRSVIGHLRQPARPELPTTLLAGKEGPFWLAERRRWNSGLELKPEDFITFTRFLDEYQRE